MTTSNVNFRNSYTGDGAEDTFDYEFKIDAESEILVIVDNVVQTLTTDYAVTGVADDNGGTVIFVSPPALDSEIILLLRAAFTQLVNLTPEGPFDSETIELELDKLTRLCLTLLAMFGTPVADKFVKWHQDAKELVASESTDVGFFERFGPLNLVADAFTIDVSFTTNAANTDYAVFVTTNWQTSYSITAKAVDGFTIEFAVAAPADNEIFVRVYVND